jgi:hypothetical protein
MRVDPDPLGKQEKNSLLCPNFINGRLEKVLPTLIPTFLPFPRLFLVWTEAEVRIQIELKC